MPPKPKFTKSEIAETALNIVRECGLNALTARELGRRLNSSLSPIFTIFDNMDDVRWAARELALKEFEAYAGNYANYKPALKRIGMLVVSYGVNESELYKLIFMQEHETIKSFDDVISSLGPLKDASIKLIKEDYNVSDEDAKTLFDQTWIHTFGLGTLCAMKVCSFTDEEISIKLGQVFFSLLTMIKSNRINETIGLPEKK